MEQKITSIQMEEFLKDWEQNSDTQLLEEGKEKNEIIAIAKAKGINLKDNKDLSGFKTIYTFANKANKNRARLPKKILLKALPSMIGKPIDIDHKRRYVVGHYIDYRYKQKEDIAIAYGVFYKSNFGEEWEEAKKLFKAKKLSTSYEIWCPENKRHKLPDGTVELLQQEIAGGALLFREEPAFEDAKVLELAKRNLDRQPEDLVFAKKYREEEIIMGNIPTTKSEQTKTTLEVKDKPKETLSKIVCSNCKEEFDYNNIGEIKCPKCFAILDKSGIMIYPPQIKDFKLICPSCHVDRWRIITKTAKEAKLKCMQCSKEYKANFVEENIDVKALLDKFGFLQVGTVWCYQCKTTIPFSGISNSKQKNLKCKKCGLEFNFDVAYERYKKVRSIEEIKELLDNTKESSEKGGKDIMVEKKQAEKASEKKVEKEHDFLENSEEKNKEEISKRLEKAKVEEPKAESKSEKVETEVKDKGKAKAKEKIEVKEEPKKDKKGEKLEEAKPETKAKLEVKDKKAEEPSEPKAEDAPKAEEKTVSKKAKEASEEATEEKVEEPKAEEKSVEEKVEEKTEPKVEKVEEPKKEEATEEKTKSTPTEEPKVKAKVEEKIETTPVEESKVEEKKLERYKVGIRKIVKKYKELKKSMDKKIKFYMDNAKIVIERREELGEFANELTDEQLLVDKDYEIATLKKKLADKKDTEIETASEVAGDKSVDDGYYKAKRNEINKKAFRKPKK